MPAALSPGELRLTALLDELRLEPGGSATIGGRDPVLACRYPLGEAAAAIHAAVGVTAARLGEDRGLPAQRVAVDVRHAAASLRGFLDQVVDGETLDPDPTGRLAGVGLFAARDGWVQTYGAFPPLEERTLAVLRCRGDREAIARAVSTRGAEELVDALVAAGAPGALVLSAAEWEAHPQGRALRELPVVLVERIGDAPPEPLPAPVDPRPLDGVRVLDLTRIIAGPACGRTLAEHGADVLQVGAPRLHEVRRAAIETAPGKRRTSLDLADGHDLARLLALVPRSDVVCQNARPGVLDRRGLGAERLAEVRPGIVHVSTDTYGHVGPWRSRPGFEPLAQCSTGWADEHRDADGRPTIVPALPCDYATGYLAALGAMVALRRRATEGGSWQVRTSLARTAMWLRDQPGRVDPTGAPGTPAASTGDLRIRLDGPFGAVDQLAPVVRMSGTPARWATPGEPAGSSAPEFGDESRGPAPRR
ncbi:CoA transferase [Patulibacter sp.]|uniref:CoA transferase n=1 Tax=Patulibacter sp. TaxID=1912859 RepID=UPI002728A367|nr:CoA transferase [Patulibacter sp.]MDO9409897.1 CoA transferase [Patulibacter sp.]